MELNVPKLASFGLKENDIPDIIEKAKKASSMKGNPIELTDEELSQIVRQSI